ncbi:PIN domain-containing protein [Candidatus Kaiserbacteria bacterium]|nr:PIN domain-containing protein [Candidatus Kaiserbacteria bacterium]
MAKPKVFVDSSVIIASLLSATGGSAYILNSYHENCEFQTNEHGLAEIQRVLKDKFADQPDLQNQLFLLLGTARIVILLNPTKRERNICAKYISEIDAPILASAIKHSDYLLTLDNEFLGKSVAEIARKNSLTILKPKDFIEQFET